MPLNESLNKILDVKKGRGYNSGNYNQDKGSVTITYVSDPDTYNFNLSKYKYEDGSDDIVLYENQKGYDMPALMIKFDSVQGAEDFHKKIFTEYNKNPTDPSSAALKLKKKRKSKKRKSKKRKSKKKLSKRRSKKK